MIPVPAEAERSTKSAVARTHKETAQAACPVFPDRQLNITGQKRREADGSIYKLCTGL